MMHMTFYWGRTVTLLFDSWKTQTWMDYGLTLCACFLFSVFYQYMEDRRIRFKLLLSTFNKISSSVAASPPSSIDTPLLLYPKLAAGGRWSPASFAGAVLFGFNSAIGYLLMLAVMSFNGGIFIAVVVGLALGYLFFRSANEDVLIVDNPCACA